MYIVFCFAKTRLEMKTKKHVFAVILGVLVFACGCSGTKPKIPDKLEMKNEGGVVQPILSVFNTNTQKIEEMPLETYILGVVAGEMDGDFPAEALKAQAVLARTYALHFVASKQSKYEGADISTDIEEAQAYAPEKINDAILDAVAETQGKVLSVGNEFIESWFFSNSGGKTASTKEAFVGCENDPEFVKVVSSPENETNSKNAVWSTWISRAEMLDALAKMGKEVSSVSKISVGKTGPSGRAISLMFGSDEISAPEFRLAVGSTRFKSTLITDIKVDKNGATFSGKGYGHGVGLSQWGAKVLAEEGNDYADILNHYFKNVKIADLY